MDQHGSNIIKEDLKLNKTLVNYGTYAGAGAVAAGVGAVLVAPAALGAIGFTSTGIAAGSYAAGMMSGAAIANGGGIAAGSTVAVLQAVGAAGLGTIGTAGVATAGAAVGVGAGIAIAEATPGETKDGTHVDLIQTNMSYYGLETAKSAIYNAGNCVADLFRTKTVHSEQPQNVDASSDNSLHRVHYYSFDNFKNTIYSHGNRFNNLFQWKNVEKLSDGDPGLAKVECKHQKD